MMSRIIVAIPGIAVILAAVWLGGPVFGVFALAVALGALFEFYGLTGVDRRLQWAGYVTAVFAVGLALWATPPDRALLAALGIGLILSAVAALTLGDRRNITGGVATVLMGILYVAMPAGVLVLSRELPDGAGVIVNLLVGVWVFDTASYFAGRLWGRRPIAPRTSPRKTWEGFIGGLVGGTAGVWVAGLYMEWISWWQSLVVGLAICLAAYAGDLFESMIKRDAGVKDSGTILAGHGGILDRFDSMLFASLAGYFTTVWMVL
jgi:phosphatidate cytidylyltransferase